jgi:DNA-binding MarR family transcriptional regulator
MPSTEIKSPFYLDVKIFYIQRNPPMINSMNKRIGKDLIDELLEDWDYQRPDLDTAPMEIVLRVQNLAKSFNDLASNKLQEFELQWWQYDVLSALRRQGEPYRMAATKLAAAGLLTSGAMTNRIDRLEQAGLVRRVKDDRDRRRVWVQLSDAGLHLVDRASDARFETATASIAGLNDRQRRQLSQLLRLLVLSLDNDPGESNG